MHLEGEYMSEFEMEAYLLNTMQYTACYLKKNMKFKRFF